MTSYRQSPAEYETAHAFADARVTQDAIAIQNRATIMREA